MLRGAGGGEVGALHQHEATGAQMAHQPLGGDAGHGGIGVMHPPAALIAQTMRQGGGDFLLGGGAKRVGHSEEPMQKPAQIARRLVLAIAAAEQPVAAAGLILDLPVIAQRRGFGLMAPPLAGDALGAIGAADAAALALPGEGGGRAIGQGGDGLDGEGG